MEHARHLAVVVAFASLSSTALAAGTASCVLENGKTVSLSGLDTVPAYRYGTAKKEELALAAGQSGVTVYKGSVMFAGGGASYVRFSIGEYSYVAYSGVGKGWDFTGLAVYKDMKRIMRKTCKGSGDGLAVDREAVNAPDDPLVDVYGEVPL